MTMAVLFQTSLPLQYLRNYLYKLESNQKSFKKIIITFNLCILKQANKTNVEI